MRIDCPVSKKYSFQGLNSWMDLRSLKHVHARAHTHTHSPIAMFLLMIFTQPSLREQGGHLGLEKESAFLPQGQCGRACLRKTGGAR